MSLVKLMFTNGNNETCFEVPKESILMYCRESYAHDDVIVINGRLRYNASLYLSNMLTKGVAGDINNLSIDSIDELIRAVNTLGISVDLHDDNMTLRSSY